MKNILLALILAFTVNTSNAYVVLDKGVKTPFAGVLLDRQDQVNINILVQDNQAREAAMIKQNDMLINLQNQKVEFEVQIEVLKEENASSNFWTKVLYFTGGILIGGAINNVRR